MVNNIFNKMFIVILCFVVFCVPVYAEDLENGITYDEYIESPIDESEFIDDNLLPTPTPEPTEYPGITKDDLQNALSDLVVHIASDQFAEISSPETAVPVVTSSPSLWDKKFDDYSPVEGYVFLIFVIVFVVAAFKLVKEF